MPADTEKLKDLRSLLKSLKKWILEAIVAADRILDTAIFTLFVLLLCYFSPAHISAPTWIKDLEHH